MVIRNAPTELMKDLHYGKGYQYAHDTQDKLTNMQCLPDNLLDREYYQPTEQGIEGRYKTRLEQIKAWKKERGK
jgi:putative ATPase